MDRNKDKIFVYTFMLYQQHLWRVLGIDTAKVNPFSCFTSDR